MAKEYGTPGPRAMYPDICTSRSVAACSLAAQLLFDRLISQADDQGRIEGDAAVIKSLCVPLAREIPAFGVGRGSKRVPGIDDLLAELEAEELLVRYQVGRDQLVQLIGWWHWQQGMRRAYASRWPAPEGWIDAVYGHGGDTPATYKLWVSAAPRGAAPHNAAFRGIAPQSAALSGALARAPRAQPPAEAGAEAGAESLPDSPPTPAERGRREDGTNPRAQGTNPRATARQAEMARRDRASRRQQAYLRHLITAEQLDEMNRRDAPLDELPAWEDTQPDPEDWFHATTPAAIRPVVELDPTTVARRRAQAIDTIRMGMLPDEAVARLRADYGISDADLGARA